jgi:hypothetical protein
MASQRLQMLAIAAASGSMPVAYLLFAREDWPFAGTAAKAMSHKVAKVQRDQWLAGDARPNRIILVRHGQTHGYSHTCSCVRWWRGGLVLTPGAGRRWRVCRCVR